MIDKQIRLSDDSGQKQVRQVSSTTPMVANRLFAHGSCITHRSQRYGVTLSLRLAANEEPARFIRYWVSRLRRSRNAMNSSSADSSSVPRRIHPR